MVAADLDTWPQMARRRSASRLAALLVNGVVLVIHIAFSSCIETTGVAVDILALAVNGRKIASHTCIETTGVVVDILALAVNTYHASY